MWSSSPNGARSAATSAGYSPRRIGSRKTRLCSPSRRRTRSASAGSSGCAAVTRVEVERDAHLLGAARPERLDAETVGEQQVVDGGHGGARLGSPGRVNAGGVAEEGRAPRLVQRRPRRHPVAEGLVDRARVLGEAIRGVAVGPTAGVLEGLRQVPVVQRHPGPDVVRQQFVDEPRVEVETGRVDRAAVGTDPWPRHREAVGVEAEIGHQRDVVGHPPVVIARRLAGVRRR